MFYLKEWATTLWDLKLRGLFFVASGLGLALLLGLRPTVETTLAALAPEAYARPYFTALFDQSVERSEVLEELQNRPEVAEVQVIGKSEANGALGQLLSTLGADYQIPADALSSFGLRVILKGVNMLERGEEIRTALTEGHGATHVTLSGIRRPRVTRLFGSHPVFRYLARFGFAGVAVPLFLLWITAFTLCFTHFTRRAWLVERFQRRTLVRAKTLAWGIAVMSAVAILASLLLQGLDPMGIVLMVMAFSVPWAISMREVQWRAQN
jgi:hypothetical protein